MGSPPDGGSTLTTSAPHSARIPPAVGHGQPRGDFNDPESVERSQTLVLRGLAFRRVAPVHRASIPRRASRSAAPTAASGLDAFLDPL